MNRRTAAACAVLTLLTLTAACGTEPGDRADGAPARDLADRVCPVVDATAQDLPTQDGTPMNTPEASALAAAVDPPKRGTGANAAYYDVYSDLIVDQPAGRVALCVTDLERGRAWRAAVAKAHPEVDVERLDLYRGRWSKKTLDAAGDRVWRNPKQYAFPLHTLSRDGTKGLTVGTSAEGAKSADFRKQLTENAGGVAVRVEATGPVEALGGDVKRG
ncbi:hypothetical protein [Streptomyces candidus]|uniref:Lipoprotein n=1 Tax=Streptomyces candidus TaxID=67283 RepID=A0A7X0LS50_9ACTN|nr:hypothetical protein [Streptomyces candidus]MBB6438104.1 hypothetical protein [Streptomyces candidus]GHH39274.1 hypothetical protein GCM10018773_18920 [Streptomyces candidus]